MADINNIDISTYKHIVFFTGAGMSAESGVPTFRGKGGIWHEYNYEEYACQKAFDKAPEQVWEFHNYRREIVGKCNPNPGHEMIAAWEKELDDVVVVTQNIDGLHQRAGSEKVFELHGGLWRVRCDVDGLLEENHDNPIVNMKTPHGNYWRPDIVWFGDQLSSAVVNPAVEHIKKCDLFVSIGTSAVVNPAARFPWFAKENGATLIEVNPQPTPISDIFDITLRGPATEMLPLLTSSS